MKHLKKIAVWQILIGLAVGALVAMHTHRAQAQSVEPYSSNLPATASFVVTPSDSADLATYPRAIFVGTGGDITVKLVNDSATRVFKNTVSGSVIPIRAKRVMSTGTTASDLVGLY